MAHSTRHTANYIDSSQPQIKMSPKPPRRVVTTTRTGSDTGEIFLAAIGTVTTANFTWSADRPVGCVGRSEPLRISLVG